MKFNKSNSNFSVLLEESFRKEFLNQSIQKFGSQAKLAYYLNSILKSRFIKNKKFFHINLHKLKELNPIWAL